MNSSLESLSRADDKPGNKSRMPVWLIPFGISIGFALLFLLLFRDRILPAQDVEVAVVLATMSDEEVINRPASSDSPMAFQASGWVEPDPLPIKATALVDGVIEVVHVLEGERVEKGQKLATLIQDDTRLALDAARKNHEIREAELTAHNEKVSAVERSVAAAKANAQAVAAFAEQAADRANRVKDLPTGAMAEADLFAIRSAKLKADAEAASAVATKENAEAQLKQHKAEIAVLENAIKMARVEVEKAELAHSRTEVLSPIEGRVLRLIAAPGQKKMLGMDDPDSATVAILYQPDKLQVRVDVPLADASGLQIGQRARIHCNLLPNQVFQGEVTRITGEADIQRNTLQAKVRIYDPSDQLRPEMLCRVEFIRGGGTSNTDGVTTRAGGSVAAWIPQSALDGEVVWVCDPDSKRVERRDVSASHEVVDGYVRITAGVLPGDWVVLSPDELSDGQRVKPNIVKP